MLKLPSKSANPAPEIAGSEARLTACKIDATAGVLTPRSHKSFVADAMARFRAS